MTIATALISRGRLLSRALMSSRKQSHCSAAVRLLSSSSTRHLSSVRPLMDEDEDEDWTPAPQASSSLLLSPPPPPVSTVQQSPPQQQDDQERDTNTDSHVGPSELVFTGNHRIPITSTLHIVTPEEDTPRGIWPVFRFMVRNFFDRFLHHDSITSHAPRFVSRFSLISNYFSHCSCRTKTATFEIQPWTATHQSPNRHDDMVLIH